MTAQLIGVATIKVGGETLRTKPGARFNPGGMANTTVMGARAEDAGYTQSAAPATLDCELMVDATTKLANIRSWTNVTILVKVDTGQQWVMRNAWRTAIPDITTGENSGASLRFEGPQAAEV